MKNKDYRYIATWAAVAFVINIALYLLISFVKMDLLFWQESDVVRIGYVFGCLFATAFSAYFAGLITGDV